LIRVGHLRYDANVLEYTSLNPLKVYIALRGNGKSYMKTEEIKIQALGASKS